jgi:YfiR/HmsC-like
MPCLSPTKRFAAVWLHGLLACTLCLQVICKARSAGLVAREYDLKAAYLFNFTKFIEWPEASFNGPAAPLVVGLLGDDPFGDVLDETVRGKAINHHPLVVKRFKHGEDPVGCQVLFISRSERDRLPEIVRALHGQGVLLVSDMDEFLERGGMITFFLDADRLKFAINPESAEQAGLKISSKLLGLAKVVMPEPAK